MHINNIKLTMSKILLVFDLYNTILLETANYKIIGLLPDTHKEEFSLVSNRATYLQKKYLQLKNYVTIEQVKQTIVAMDLNDAFHQLFNYFRAHKHKYECIIISGSNTLYLEWLIEHHNLSDIFSNFMPT
jgi:pyridoxal phosphate phosphatase PHOSPHO2